MEWNHGVTYQQNSTNGELFIKLPNISFPFTDSGDLILAMGNQVHTDAEISVPLEAALKSGTLDVGKIMAGAKPANCVKDSTNATFHLSTSINPHPSRAEESAITIGHYTTDIEDGVCVWKLSGAGEYLDFPHYFDGELKPVDVAKVPPELAAQAFPLDLNGRLCRRSRPVNRIILLLTLTSQSPVLARTVTSCGTTLTN